MSNSSILGYIRAFCRFVSLATISNQLSTILLRKCHAWKSTCGESNEYGYWLVFEVGTMMNLINSVIHFVFRSNLVVEIIIWLFEWVSDCFTFTFYYLSHTTFNGNVSSSGTIAFPFGVDDLLLLQKGTEVNHVTVKFAQDIWNKIFMRTPNLILK